MPRKQPTVHVFVAFTAHDKVATPDAVDDCIHVITSTLAPQKTLTRLDPPSCASFDERNIVLQMNVSQSTLRRDTSTYQCESMAISSALTRSLSSPSQSTDW